MMYNTYQATFLISRKCSHDPNSCAVWNARKVQELLIVKERCQDTETQETVKGAEAESDIRGITSSSVYWWVYRTVRNNVDW